MVQDILVVDDEKDIRFLIKDILEDSGYTSRTVANSTDTFKAINENVPSAVILDIWLQGSELDGLGILEVIKKKHPHVPVLVISGHGNIETAITAIRLGAYDYIEKPFKAEKLLLALGRAIEANNLRIENDNFIRRDLQEEALVGTSQAIANLRSAIDRVAATESRVLISGHRGNGKEIVARNIHNLSNRKAGSFVVLNTLNTNKNDIEQLLFGREEDVDNFHKNKRQIGLLEQAQGGTLFINEITGLPLYVQSKLLSFLQSKQFHRVGGESPITIDARVISSTSKDAVEEITSKRLREDLYNRLNVVSIKVPCLAERKDDIPILCKYFVKQIANNSGLPIKSIDSNAIAALQTYDWPNNIQELRNLIEWLLMSAADHNTITIKMLPKFIVKEGDDSGSESSASNVNSEMISMPLREARETFEKKYLSVQVKRFSGNISKTASFIGMERSALHRKLKILEINSDMVGSDV